MKLKTLCENINNEYHLKLIVEENIRNILRALNLGLVHVNLDFNSNLILARSKTTLVRIFLPSRTIQLGPLYFHFQNDLGS